MRCEAVEGPRSVGKGVGAKWLEREGTLCLPSFSQIGDARGFSSVWEGGLRTIGWGLVNLPLPIGGVVDVFVSTIFKPICVKMQDHGCRDGQFKGL